MIKKLIKNKKLLLGLTVILLGAAIALSGITGAWWYIDSETADDANNNGFDEFTMGKLAVSVGVVDSEIDVKKTYEPGEEQDFSITIENKGTVDAFVKLNLSGFTGGGEERDENIEVSFKSDVIDELEKLFNEGKDEDFAKYIELDKGGYVLSIWEDETACLMLYGETKVTLKNCVSVKFIGGENEEPYSDDKIGMDNGYMEKKINFALDWAATQRDERAILAKLDIDIKSDDFVFIAFGFLTED